MKILGQPCGFQVPDEIKPLTLKMETQILAEFDGNQDPDLLALYHHMRDQVAVGHRVIQTPFSVSYMDYP